MYVISFFNSYTTANALRVPRPFHLNISGFFFLFAGVDGGSEERENRLGPGTPPLSKSRRRRGTPPQGLRAEQIEEEPLSKLSLTPKHEQQVRAPSTNMHINLYFNTE